MIFEWHQTDSATINLLFLCFAFKDVELCMR